jgi:predicted amidohydrolase
MTLQVALVQTSIYQNDTVATLAHTEELLAQLPAGVDVVLLPETFNTGFSNDITYAEVENMQTHKWMKQQAKRLNALVVGSLMWRIGDEVYNRMLGIGPNEEFFTYDKHNLFTFAGEDEVITAGRSQSVWQYKNWILRPIICFDLRFPEWMRRTAIYPADLYLVVANWPNARQPAWDALLPARAVENQTFVVGVNRAQDLDGHESGILYGGGSAAYNPQGQLLGQLGNEEATLMLSLDKNDQENYRTAFPFWQDADGFK